MCDCPATRRVSSLTSTQIDQLAGWFDDLWWTRGRRRAGVEVMVEHRVVIAFVDALVAFARVLSDRVQSSGP